MARQGSNNSLPSYHASPHMAHRPMMHQGMAQGMTQVPPHSMSHGMGQSMPHNMQQNMSQGMPQGLPQGMHGIPQNGQVATHLPNYGNPSTLPPKPPPGV